MCVCMCACFIAKDVFYRTCREWVVRPSETVKYPRERRWNDSGNIIRAYLQSTGMSNGVWNWICSLCKFSPWPPGGLSVNSRPLRTALRVSGFFILTVKSVVFSFSVGMGESRGVWKISRQGWFSWLVTSSVNAYWRYTQCQPFIIWQWVHWWARHHLRPQEAPDMNLALETHKFTDKLIAGKNDKV